MANSLAFYLTLMKRLLELNAGRHVHRPFHLSCSFQSSHLPSGKTYIHIKLQLSGLSYSQPFSIKENNERHLTVLA